MLQVKKLSQHARLPEYGTAGAAGLDLFAADMVVIGRDCSELIPLDLAFRIPCGYVGVIKSRSSMAVKGLHVQAGVIDSDYRGHVKVLLQNTGQVNMAVHKGDKIAQMIVLPTPAMTVCEVDQLDDTERGCGGFGSTGT